MTAMDMDLGSPKRRSSPAAGSLPLPRLMERRKHTARQEIVSVALGLFVRDGFDATTVESIAAAAGCSTRTFYRYFGSKEDVMFHDLSEVIGAMAEVLDGRLAAGEHQWSALTESLVDFIGRFDAVNQEVATQRMDLWSHEPALRDRYLLYVAQAEQTVLNTLCRRRGTDPDADDTAQLMALAAVGAYRATVTTHRGASRKLGEHLRDSLAILGAGLGRG
jgi:AcrR family transcriptional regulator